MRRSLAAALVLFLSAFAVAPAVAQQPDLGRIQKRVLELVNQQRSLNGQRPLILDERLSRAAQVHAENMARRDFFDHQAPDGSQVSGRAVRAGYPWRLIGENLAAGHSSERGVVNGWMISPAHRDNMLGPDFRELGVGYARPSPKGRQPKYDHYWTVVFGAPAR
ncbi:MAG: CAP domain-containing protein [Alphaproteobacteria bacterium]